MAHYQNTGLTNAGTLLQGGFAIYVAATAGTLAGAGGTNFGLGDGPVITENIENFSVQAGNGPDPLEGVAEQSVTITFNTLEFYIPTWDTVRGQELDTVGTASVGTYVTGGSVHTISTGGFTELGTCALKFVNTKLVSGATVETAIVFYKCNLTQGLSFTAKSDNDDDPVMVIPWTLEAKLDTSRTAGDQLYIIETEMAV
jgi:hypothetical protein